MYKKIIIYTLKESSEIIAAEGNTLEYLMNSYGQYMVVSIREIDTNGETIRTVIHRDWSHIELFVTA